MSKVSCIIPAYNEAPRIAHVLHAAENHPLIAEIIVVDDCSTDGTKDIVKKFSNVTLVVHEKNTGKSKAICDGVRASKMDTLLFLDADLLDLTKENITALIEPVISGQANVSISMRKNSPWTFRLIGFDYISGERVFRRSYIEKYLNEIEKLRSFGLEVFLNNIFIKEKCTFAIIFWKNVESPLKFKKMFGSISIRSDIYVAIDALRTASIFTILYQFIQIFRRKIKI